MAFRATAVLQTENMHTDIGKYGGQAGKTDLPKPAKNGRQDRRPFGDLSNTRRQDRKPFADLSNTGHLNRKPLQDVSNTVKPPVSATSKGLVLHDNSALRARGITKNASKGKFMTSEDIKKCHEWAKEGIEQAHFTGNDLEKMQKNAEERRVKRKVEKVITAVHEWSDLTYDFVFPTKREISKDIIDVERMEIEEEEILLPKSLSTSDKKESNDLLCETEIDILPFLEFDVELKMEDDSCTTTTTNDPACPSALPSVVNDLTCPSGCLQ